MIKSSSSDQNPCGGGTNSNCVTWQGGDMECLGIENGQNVSETVNLIATQVCELMDTLDLSDMDLKCIFDLCVSCPEPEKTLKVVLDLIVNKVCSLDEAIKNISTATETGVDPILLLASCFQYTDVDGDLVTELPHSQYTKRIANIVCQILLDVSSLQDDVQNLQNTINDIQEQINDIETEIPDVTSDCLFVGTKSIDDAWDILDQAFCQHRTAVGSTTDINLALGRLCSDLNTEFSAEPGWVLSPDNLAQAVNNVIIAFCSLRNRVTANELCCQATCDDVGIGFNILLNPQRTLATIKFTSGAGTSLPAGFEDAGSIMTITDEHGNSIEENVEISNGGEVDIDLTGLDPNDDYEFSLDAKVSDGVNNCQKCVKKNAIFSSTCDFCEVCVTGTTGTVTIVYEDNGTFVSTSFSPTTTSTTTTTTASP